MTEQEYLTYARTNQEALKSLIKTWHPTNRPDEIGDIEITAAGAERACEQVRARVKLEDIDKPDAVTRFNEALSNNDWQAINKLLNDTWFGVPESRDCWSIIGFKEAVHLIEEPPDDN